LREGADGVLCHLPAYKRKNLEHVFQLSICNRSNDIALYLNTSRFPQRNMNILGIYIFLVATLLLQVLVSIQDFSETGSNLFLLTIILSSFAGFLCTLGFAQGLSNSKQRYQIDDKIANSLCVTLNVLTIIGTSLLIFFINSNVSSFTPADLAIFAEAYRNSAYKGSGLYTGISCYLLPVTIGYLVSIDLKFASKLIVPISLCIISSILLGLRIFVAPIVIPLAIAFIFKKREKPYKNSFVFFLLLTLFVIAFSFASKWLLSTVVVSVEGDDLFMGVIKSVVGRINYSKLIGAVHFGPSDEKYLLCLFPGSSFTLSNLCNNIDLLKYSLLDSSSFRSYGGSFAGFSLPLPLVAWSYSPVLLIILIMFLPALMYVCYKYLLRSAPFSLYSVIAFCIVTSVQLGFIEDSFIAFNSLLQWILFIFFAQLCWRIMPSNFKAMFRNSS
jgi:hypothetical protein